MQENGFDRQKGHFSFESDIFFLQLRQNSFLHLVFRQRTESTAGLKHIVQAVFSSVGSKSSMGSGVAFIFIYFFLYSSDKLSKQVSALFVYELERMRWSGLKGRS